MSVIAYWDKVYALRTRANISSNDGIWDSLLSYSPQIAIPDAEFYSIISTDDVRQIRPENMEMWLIKVIERLEGLCKTGIMGSNQTITPQIDNCLRILNRICPIMYEEQRSRQLLWGLETQLGVRILRVLCRLMHFNGYTIPLSSFNDSSSGVVIWYPGVGCSISTTPSPNNFYEARLKVVLCVLSVLSEPMYDTPATPALDYWTTVLGKDPNILCSLINTSFVFSTTLQLNTKKQQLSLLSLVLLLISVTHLPTARGKNQFRRLLSKLRKQEDITWLINSLETCITRGRGLATAYLVRVESETNPTLLLSSTLWISFVWELIQSNRSVGESPVCTGIAQQLVQMMSHSGGHDLSKRLSTYALTSLTAENHWCADKIGISVWESVWTHRDELDQPGIHLASMIDVFHNCAPFTALSEKESHQFMSVLRQINNPAVLSIFKQIARSLQVQSVGLNLSSYDVEASTAEGSIVREVSSSKAISEAPIESTSEAPIATANQTPIGASEVPVEAASVAPIGAGLVQNEVEPNGAGVIPSANRHTGDTPASIPTNNSLHNKNKSAWEPIQFHWNDRRLKWYNSTIWGAAAVLEPNIWNSTKISLFKIRIKSTEPPVMWAARYAASKITDFIYK